MATHDLAMTASNTDINPQHSHPQTDQPIFNPALSAPPLRSFFHYLVPSVVGLVAITTANLVDGIFVGHKVGGEALASITLLVPYFTLLVAMALALAIGGSVRAGKYVGEENWQAASAIFSKCLIATATILLLAAIASLGFTEQLYQLLGAPPSLQPLMHEYFSVIRWVLILQLLTMVLYYFVRADGHPQLATSALVVGALTNILLDAWFVLHLDWGLAGAAYATAIAQLLQFCVLARYFRSPKRGLRFSLRQRNWGEVLHAGYNGLSEFINEISVGLIFLLLNTLMISRLGVAGVAAFSVINYFIFFSIMLCYGIADALHLVVSQNFGAGQINRIRQFLIIAVACAFTFGCLVIGVLLTWQTPIIKLFLGADSGAIIPLASQLLAIVWPLFFVNGLNIVLSCYLTAIHQPTPSAIIASCRSLILPASLLAGLYLWLEQPESMDFMIALPLAEWGAFAIALALFFRYRPSRLAV